MPDIRHASGGVSRRPNQAFGLEYSLAQGERADLLANSNAVQRQLSWLFTSITSKQLGYARHKLVREVVEPVALDEAMQCGVRSGMH